MNPDHRDENLRRSSFAAQPLQAANFEGADLRGTDFSRADLSNASFRNARFGVPPLVGVLILLGSLALSIIFGAIAGFAFDAVRDRLYSPGWERPSGAAGILVVLAVFVFVMFWKGMDAAIKTYLWTFAILLAANVVVRLIWGQIDIAVAARGIALALVLAFAVVSGIVGRVVGGALGAWGIAVVAILSGLAAGRAHGGLAALVISVSMVLISKRSLRGDPRDRSLRVLAHRMVDRWGTRFVRADLSGADFTGTDATHCDVTDARLDGVRWEPGHAPLAVLDTAEPHAGQ
jgi:hypothetical protein